MSSNSQPRPWQFDWKRPQWESPQENLDQKVPKGRLTHHTAAAVQEAEVRNHITTAALDTSTTTASSSLILTVTLVSTRPPPTKTNFYTVPTSNVILLELMRQQSSSAAADDWIRTGRDETTATNDDTSSSGCLECLQSRMLQWPESALDQTDASAAETASERGGNIFLRFPFKSSSESSSKHHNNKQPLSGLVSVSLCRLPPVNATVAVMQDALDVVHLLSLGMTSAGLSVPQKEWLAYLQQNQDDDGNDISPDNSVVSDKDASDLVLACLTSDGQVHLYSPWELLGTAAPKAAAEQSTGLDNAMASLMLGDGVLASIQESILPLSEPMHTVSLAVPWYQPRKKKQPRLQTAIEEEAESQQQQSSLLLWDPSAWDPAIDAATYRYRTTDNVPVTSVFALDYLCIAGRGRRRKRRGRRGDTSTFATPPSTPQSIFSRKTHVSLPLIQPAYQDVVTDRPQWVDGVVTTSVDEGDSVTAASQSSVQTGMTGVSGAGSTVHSERQGGFVTFISLRNFSETRTVYLPFVPCQISPFVWGGMSFLLVLGGNLAVAIRTDASDVSSVSDGRAPSLFTSPSEHDGNMAEVEGSGPVVPGSKQKDTLIPIRRFQVLPIRFPEPANTNCTIVASELSTSPPGIVFLSTDEQGTTVIRRTLTDVHLIAADEAVPLFSEYKPNVGEEQLAVIETEFRQAARVGSSLEAPLDHEATWCHLGQGWCLVGSVNVVYFICWEGAMASSGPFVFELAEDARECVHGLVSNILPLNPFMTGSLAAYQDIKLPFSGAYDKPAAMQEFSEAKESELTDIDEELDDIVVEALESISSLTYREKVVKKSSPVSPRRKSTAFTSREKSIRLLRQCSSWTQLEQTQQTRAHFELQEPAVSVRMGASSDEQFILSLRRIVVENGEATPFQQALSWLSDQEDYFTAASLALALLQDTESLRHLWTTFNKVDDSNEGSRLEGLLDGVVPIYGANDENAPMQSTLTQLADMTVGCLTKGGNAMASTLEYFVQRNQSYDPSRACLMLVARAASSLSDDDEIVMSTMGKDYKKSDTHYENIMWPVRCLLQIGVAREQLFTALLLLNVTVPDELRHRRRSGIPTPSLPSMDMCKSLVSLIVASSPEAADLLLGLVDEQSRQPFWQSLQHDAQLELSLIAIDGNCPMLQQAEVRAWTLQQLQQCMEVEGSASSVNVFETMPTEWLKSLVMACLSNAGCPTDALLTSNFGQTLEEEVESDGLTQHVEELQTTRSALVPSVGSGGLDFDILIPSLLILQDREVSWREGSKVPTQSILDAACYLAGRRNAEEPLFALDSTTIMRQCTLTGNVSAGANLVGGKNGLVLECCDILMHYGVSMEDAERFLLSDPMPPTISSTGEQEKSFTLECGHRHILWLLEEHVLRIRTYGEFETTHMRGKLDPIFAATVCLRAWWGVTRRDLDKATAWLVRWLSHQLGMTTEDEDASSSRTKCSPHRLVCAALVRALVWPSDVASAAPVLATRLQLPSHFLVMLAQSCCGLVEAVPATVADEAWKVMNASSSTMNVTIPDTSQNPAVETLALEPATELRRSTSSDSVLSAVSSIHDMDQ